MAEDITTIGELPSYTLPAGLDTTFFESEDQTVVDDFVARKISMRELILLARSHTDGSANYDDTATSGTPIVGVANVPYVLTCNGAGAQSYEDMPDGVGPLWNVGTSSFDFSDLAPIDIVRFRMGATITTTTANQSVEVYMRMAIGGFEYNIPLGTAQIKTAGAFSFSRYTMAYMGDSNTLDNPAQIMVLSDAATTTVVAGWTVEVDRKTF